MIHDPTGWRIWEVVPQMISDVILSRSEVLAWNCISHSCFGQGDLCHRPNASTEFESAEAIWLRISEVCWLKSVHTSQFSWWDWMLKLRYGQKIAKSHMTKSYNICTLNLPQKRHGISLRWFGLLGHWCHIWHRPSLLPGVGWCWCQDLCGRAKYDCRYLGIGFKPQCQLIALQLLWLSHSLLILVVQYIYCNKIIISTVKNKTS